MLTGWRNEMIEKNRVYLTKDIDLNEELFNRMITKGVLVTTKRDEIKIGYEVTEVCVRRLLEYLQTRPETDFDNFCECLRQTNQVHIVEAYLTEPERDPENDETPSLLDVDQGSPERRRCPPDQMCTRKARLLTFGFAAISVTVIIVVSVMTSKSQTRSESLFYSAAPAINITNACLNATMNGTPTVPQDGRCGKRDPGFYPDVGSCASFYLCCAGGKLAGEGTCPGNYSFHPESQFCVDTRDTFYRDPSHCGKYYQCYGTPPRRTEQRSCHEDAYFRLDPPPPTCAHKDNVEDCHQKPLIPTL